MIIPLYQEFYPLKPYFVYSFNGFFCAFIQSQKLFFQYSTVFG
nr:MAG TPA: hypothetical protein [Caudoviricetes sp.]